MDGLNPTVDKHKISQIEFDDLYLATLDDCNYRYLINDTPVFDLPKLLNDHHFLLDLSGLNLRHRNFRHAIFSGICLDYSDLRGAICHNANFTDVHCEKIIIDVNSQFHGAKLTKAQLLQLQTHAAEQPSYIANSPVELGFNDEEWSFA